MSESNKFWDVRHGKHTKVERFANLLRSIPLSTYAS